VKKPILTILIILSFFFGMAAPTIKVVNNNDDWLHASAWDLNRVPQSGDTVVIPAGKTLFISTNVSISSLLYIKVYGTLKLSGGILDLSTLATIIVYSGGKITGNACSCEQIRIGNTKKYTGSDTDVTGPQYASVTTSDFDPMITVLPVKFESFTLIYSNQNVQLQWKTSEEINASYFEAERSYNGSDWTVIANVTAKGNSSIINIYTATDKNITARVVYYRIRETDVDGKFIYSIVNTLKNDNSSQTVHITSSQNEVYLQFINEVKGKISVQIYSLSGQLLDQQNIQNPSGYVKITTRIKGNCIISLNDAHDLHVAKQIIL
jgi:hypothetical protein